MDAPNATPPKRHTGGRRIQFRLTVLLWVVTVLCSYMAGRSFATNKQAIEHTGRSMDLAIVGPGFFRVYDRTTEEYRYTRRGSFEIDAFGQIAINGTTCGLEPGVTIPSDVTEIDISSAGTVQGRMEDDIWVQFGKLQLASFARPGALKPVGRGFYEETDESGKPLIGVPGPCDLGWVQSGWLERDPPKFDVHALIACWLILITAVSILALAKLHAISTALGRERWGDTAELPNGISLTGGGAGR